MIFLTSCVKTCQYFFQDVSSIKMYTSRKTFVAKILVIACLVYLCVHVLLSNTGAPIIRELQESGRSLAALDSSALEAEMKEPLPIAEPTKVALIVDKEVGTVVSVSNNFSCLFCRRETIFLFMI